MIRPSPLSAAVLPAALVAFALFAAPVAAKREEPPDLGAITLDRADPAVDATIAGVPARLAVTVNLGVYLTSALAARVPGAWRRGQSEDVGRMKVAHREAALDIAIAGVAATMRAQTQDEPCCGPHEGAIGATDLPWSIVRIGDAAGRPERLFPATTDEQSGLSIPWTIGGKTIHLVLAPEAPTTVATASAAAILAQAYGGHLLNGARQVPIAYGISRTVRDMRFDRPIAPLGFRLDVIATRVADFAGRTELPEPVLPPPAADEIVVRHKPIPPQFGWAAITIGRDLLGRCPMIAVYRNTGEIGLACDPG